MADRGAGEKGAAASPAEGGEAASPARGRRWGVRLMQLALTVAVTWFILDRVGLTLDDVRTLDLSRWTPHWGMLVLSALVLFSGYVISAVLWGVMVRELGGPALPPGTAFRVFFVANLGRYIPGKVWQIAGLALLARRHGVSGSLATAAAVLGQAFAVAGATVVGLAAFFSGGEELRRWGGVAAVVVLAVVALFAVPAFLRRVLSFWFRVTRRPVPEGLEPGPLFGIRWVALYGLNWVVYAGAFWLLARSFELPGGPLLLGPAFAAAYVLGYLMIFAPAGIGVREGFLVAFVEPVMGVGAGSALAVVARLWATVVEVGPAAAVAATHLGEATGEGRSPGARAEAGGADEAGAPGEAGEERGAGDADGAGAGNGVTDAAPVHGEQGSGRSDEGREGVRRG